MVQLEDESEVAIPDSEYDGVRTPGQLVDLVDAKRRGRQNPNEHGRDDPAASK